MSEENAIAAATVDLSPFVREPDSDRPVFHDDTINALWGRVLKNGHDHADRTGKGRRSIFGEQIRFNVSDFSLPLQTTRKIFTRGMIEETLWFVKGSEMASELEEKNVNIWKLWTVTDEDIETFITKLAERKDLQDTMLMLRGNGEEDQDPKELVKEYYRSHLAQKKGSIGKLYGSMWRNAPQQTDTDMQPFWPDVEPEDIPSDKLALYTKEYEEMKFFAKGSPIPEFKTYVRDRYYSTVDQLGNLIINLKKRPYSSRHVVVAWVPSHAPFEAVGPQENVLLGKSALTACHAMFQCFVNPPREEGGKLRLSLMMTIRSQDVAVGSNYNMVQYCILLMMLAQACDMEPYEYIHSVGDCHFYLNHIDQAWEQIKRVPFKSPHIKINPEVKDFFAFKPEDFEIVGYEHHPGINYEVAK